MPDRKLIDGSIAKEYSDPVTITVYTKAPTKWKLTDMQTGEEYIADFRPAKVDALAMIKMGGFRNIQKNTYGTWVKIEKTTE
jgi:hypothetical protein